MHISILYFIKINFFFFNSNKFGNLLLRSIGCKSHRNRFSPSIFTTNLLEFVNFYFFSNEKGLIKSKKIKQTKEPKGYVKEIEVKKKKTIYINIDKLYIFSLKNLM